MSNHRVTIRERLSDRGNLIYVDGKDVGYIMTAPPHNVMLHREGERLATKVTDHKGHNAGSQFCEARDFCVAVLSEMPVNDVITIICVTMAMTAIQLKAAIEDNQYC